MRELIRSLLVAQGWTQADFAQRLGTTQMTVSRWLRGSEPRGDKRDRILELARQAGLIEDGENRTIKVVGRVGAGAKVDAYFEQEPSDEDVLELIDLAYPTDRDFIGFRVLGDSMSPAYEENSIILVEREQPCPLDRMIGLSAAVLAYGDEGAKIRYLKRIRSGSRPHAFNLESINDRSPTIENVRIIWASPVRLIIPNFGPRTIRPRHRREAEHKTKVRR